MSEKTRKPRRRFRWWLIPLIVIGLAVATIVALVLSWRAREAASNRPATLPPPPPTAEAGLTGLYQTGFDDPASPDWELFDDGRISARITDGRLIVGVNAMQDTGAWSGLNYTFGDFLLHVEATKLDGPDNNAMIVVFRLTDTQNYNRFDVSSDGYYRLSAVRNGVSTIISDWGASPAILTGDSVNRLAVWASGGTFRFWVNGTPLPLCITTDPASQPIWDPTAAEPTCLGGQVVMQWQNADLPQGKIGLGAQGYTGYDGEQTTPAFTSIGFDNLLIEVAPPPEALEGLQP